MQTEDWSELKAAYRLIDSPCATFQALAEPHWKLTCAGAKGVCLILGDTTEIDFGILRKIKGVGTVGNNWGQGFLLHSGLLVDAASEQVLGLAGQVIRHRKPAPRGENTSQRLKRPRESEIWGELIEQIGPPPDDAQYVHVFDRGADNFEVFCRLLLCRDDWVIRAAQLTRRVSWMDGEGALEAYLDQLGLAGSYKLQVREQGTARPYREIGSTAWNGDGSCFRAFQPLVEGLRHYLDWYECRGSSGDRSAVGR